MIPERHRFFLLRKNRESEIAQCLIGLARLRRRIAVPLWVKSGRNRLRRRKKKVAKVKDRLMDILHKMIFPVRRVWLALSAHLKARKTGI